LENKVKHGQHIISVARQFVGKEDTFQWLKRGDLKVETESEITSAPDKALRTKYHAIKYEQKQIKYADYFNNLTRQ